MRDLTGSTNCRMRKANRRSWKRPAGRMCDGSSLTFMPRTRAAHRLRQAVLARIAALYAVEQTVRGKPPDERSRIRRLHTKTKLDELRQHFAHTLTQVSRKSDVAEAIAYALTRWVALTRIVDDGTIEIDNNAAKRATLCGAVTEELPLCRL
jgi:Transposase IS66 family